MAAAVDGRWYGSPVGARRTAAAADAAGGVVMEGRDIGEKVLPDADLKLFVTASAHYFLFRWARQRV